jgi:predicted phosphodiesterase
MGMKNEIITIGLITDTHYANIETVWLRYYRDSILKVRKAIKAFNDVMPSFFIHLGDNVDNGITPEIELGYLKSIEAEYEKFNGTRHYVIGNHDVASFSKEQFLEVCGGRKNYYSFDEGDLHFIILDACYNEDESDYNKGNFDWIETYIPIFEQEWLKSDLDNTSKKTIIFVHQRLDDEDGVHGVKNAYGIRQAIEESGKVIAVFQGHDHQGDSRYINNIPYFTFRAVVEGHGLENSAYSLIHVYEDSSISIEGFGKQKSASLNI